MPWTATTYMREMTRRFNTGEIHGAEPRIGRGTGPDLAYCEWGVPRRLSNKASVAAPAARCRECHVITWRLADGAEAPHRTQAAHLQGCSQPLSRLES